MRFIAVFSSRLKQELCLRELRKLGKSSLNNLKHAFIPANGS